MLIDWFTVAAQGVNFVILVWLLKHFLYKPILGAIDAREKHIAAELADANAKKVEAQKERDDFQNKNKVFDEQRAGLLAKAKADADVERDRLIGDAHKKADALSFEQATALTSLAQQPDASATITRTLFVGLAMIESTAIYCFVVSMILIFANPFWTHVIAKVAGK